MADAQDGGAQDLAAAVRAALARVTGTYALAVVSAKRPDEIVAAKNASPLVVGFGQGESFLASDVPAILEHTREVVYIEEGELAVLTAEGIRSRVPAASASRRSRGASSGARWQPRRMATSTSCTRRSSSSRGRSPTPSAAASPWSRAT